MAEFVQSFERGLAVIRSFAAAGQPQTLSDVAKATGLSRATARRLVLTLEELGYVRGGNGRFQLTPRILELGYAFLSSFSVPALAVPYLERFSATVNESSSVAVLDGTSIVYVARVPAKRVMTVSIGLGSRFPAYQTSLGRVLLGALADEEVARIWEASDRSSVTERTVSTLDELLEKLAEVRDQGWALVDQELELGVRSIAAPIRNGAGEVVAAANVSTHASRTTKAELLSRFLPELLRTVDDISRAVAVHPAGMA
ncbi:MAG: IclR family transcriptional regulator [Actinobacteria bacterium]|nr:MAG: IclR family transcriptional regulator [Actinomycetota bacterium]